jgi:molybdenum cofactor cytidylyltransferase
MERHPVIVLAAGKSSRAGMPKGLIDIDGRPWLEHQLDALKHHGLRNVLVVLGHHAELYRPVIEARSVRQAVNPEPDRGPFSSLQTGLAALPRGSTAWVLPLDVPCPSQEVWMALQQRFSEGGAEVVMPVVEGRGGHPVLLSAEMVTRLLQLALEHPESRLDHQIRALPEDRVARIEVKDRRVLDNLNTAEDFARHRRGSG